MGNNATLILRVFLFSAAVGICVILVNYPLLLNVTESPFLSRQDRASDLSESAEDETEEEFMIRKKNEMQLRLERVRRVCEELNTHFVRGVRRPFFLVDLKHKLGYCRTPKVSTTTLLSYFLELSDFEEEEKDTLRKNWQRLHTTLANSFLINETTFKSMDLVLKHLKDNDIFSFSFVRHPYDRIVSAFDDKLIKNKPAGYYNRLAKQINGNFSAFIDYLIGGYDKFANRGCILARGACETDEHYAPYYAWCGYCDINYKAIGKSENFAEDWRYIVKAAGLQNVVHDFQLQMHATNHSSQRGIKYFSQLSKAQKDRVYEIYKWDFDMFGYSTDGYS